MTGISGFDEITDGGLPRGRPTLVCGAPGCGKTAFGMEILVNGALKYDEPGVFISFEETVEELTQNASSFGWDLAALEAEHKVVIDHIKIDPTLIQEAGAYDLEGLFIRLDGDIAQVGAKRVVIDTIEVLFASLNNQAVLRSELRRLFAHLKEKGVTAVITAERGTGGLTRNGLEEYVSDCVILLDHRVSEDLSTRRLRVVKYRGSGHVTDETPFMMNDRGFQVVPLSSLRLEHAASTDRVSSGIARLDTMLGGDGYYRGGSILMSGTPGSGKTTLASCFLAAACDRGERGMLFAYEESPAQLMRNLRSVGIHLQPYVDAGLLKIIATRPTSQGLEANLGAVTSAIEEFEPQIVVVDPISSFGTQSTLRDSMLTRLVDLMKQRGVTALFTAIQESVTGAESGYQISSVIDAWLALGSVEHNGERNRSLRIIKARGSNHSNQVREFQLSSDGVELVDVYTGTGPPLMGTARQLRDSSEQAERERLAEVTVSRRQAIDRRRAAVEAQVAALWADLQFDIDALEADLRGDAQAAARLARDRESMTEARHADRNSDVDA